MKLTERVIRAIKRVFEGQALPEDKNTIDQWYTNLDSDTTTVDEDRQKVKQRIFEKVYQPQAQPRISYFKYSVAAAILIVSFVTGYLYLQEKPTTDIVTVAPEWTAIDKDMPLHQAVNPADVQIVNAQIKSVKTPKAKLYQLVLEDGTQVWLNAGSVLEKITFDGKQRHVHLNGEAYFEVSKDPNRPFVIHTAQQTVTVLGTKFNLKSYANQKEVLSLVEGSVRITDKQHQSIVLTPGEAAEVEKGKLIKSNLHENNLLWREQIFAFENESLPEILDKVSRWYNVSVAPLPASTHRYSGKIHPKAMLDEVLNMLSLVSQQKVVLENNQILVK